jgi:hypothetical protein
MKKNEIISYDDIFNEEWIKPIRWMYFDVKWKDYWLVLMNTSSWAKYDDAGDDYNWAITYEWHNLPQKKDWDDVTLLDQPMYNKNWTLTENWKFYESAKICNWWWRAKKIKVYQKYKMWVRCYRWLYNLTNAWIEKSSTRDVFKFLLEPVKINME